jgi:hypothetical protein
MWERWVQKFHGVGTGVRNAWVSVFSPNQRRREKLRESMKKSQEVMARSFSEKGYHVTNVGKKGNIQVIRRSNGDRIVLFRKNLEENESFEHFFPENWQRFGRTFDATRAVGQVSVKGGTGRSYMIKTVSPFRPPIRVQGETHMGNTTFTEARILLDLQADGFSPEIPVAVLMRTGYLPTLITRFIKGARMASWVNTSNLQERLRGKGYKPNDLFRLEEQRLMAFSQKEPNVNALETSDKVTHPVDVELYEVSGESCIKKKLIKKGEYPVFVPVQKKEKLARFERNEISRPLSHYDYVLRRWKRSDDVVPFDVELRAFVPGKVVNGRKELDAWVPVEKAPNATWRRFVLYDTFRKQWVLPEHAEVHCMDPKTKKVVFRPAFSMADGRFHAYVGVDPSSGRVQESKSLVKEIFES